MSSNMQIFTNAVTVCEMFILDMNYSDTYLFLFYRYARMRMVEFYIIFISSILQKQMNVMSQLA